MLNHFCTTCQSHPHLLFFLIIALPNRVRVMPALEIQSRHWWHAPGQQHICLSPQLNVLWPARGGGGLGETLPKRQTKYPLSPPLTSTSSRPPGDVTLIHSRIRFFLFFHATFQLPPTTTTPPPSLPPTRYGGEALSSACSSSSCLESSECSHCRGTCEAAS